MKPETLIRDLSELLKSYHMSEGNVHEECDVCIAIRRAKRYLTAVAP
jgi:hypothetical protein